MSPAVKAEINDMKSAQKEIMADRKAAAAKKGTKNHFTCSVYTLV